MNMTRRRFSLSMAAAPAALGAPRLAHASDRPLTIVLTVPPGTASDTIARVLGESLRKTLDRPVIVESRPGGSGGIAINYIRQMPGDGNYLLLAPSSAIALYPHFFNKPPFDASKILVPVCDGAGAPHGITVSNSTPVKTFDEYIAYVREKPAMGSIGTPSTAGLANLLIYQIRKSNNIDVRGVPYKGGSPLLADLLGGQVPASASILPDYLNDFRAGRLRILGQASETRSVLAREIPTFAELGYTGMVARTTFGFFARIDTPPEVVGRYAKLITAALTETAVVDRLHGIGLEPVGGTPAQYQQRLNAETARWVPTIKESGMTID